MNYPNLSKALSDYCKYVQLILKSGVNIRTGALQKSIKVTCTIDDQSYSLFLNANNYWRFLKNPFPLDSIFTTAGLPSPQVHTSFPPDQGSRYSFDFSRWQQRFNDAFRLDILQSLSI